MEKDLKNSITSFREEIANFTEEELNNKKGELQNEISKMILDCDMILKIAIIDARLKELKGE